MPIVKVPSDLFPVGGGEFVREGGDSVLELQDAGVSLGQRVPKTLELFGQTPQLALRLLQLGLREGELREEEGKRKTEREKKREAVLVNRELKSVSGTHSCNLKARPSITCRLFLSISSSFL